MRVLFLASYFPKPTNTTMGTWALEQAQAFRRAGLDVRVRSYNSWFPKALSFHPGIRRYAACPRSHSWDGLSVDYPQWPVYPFGAFNGGIHRRPLLQLRAAWPFVRSGLFRAVETFKPDIVYAHHTSPNGFLALQINERFGIPFVVTDHTFLDVDEAITLPGRRKLYDAVCARASAMIGVSRRMTRSFDKICHAGKAITVFNGGDAVDAAAVSRPRPKELQGKIIVASVGILYERKAFPLLVRAFARIADRHPNSVLRIVGDGRDRPNIEKAIQGAGMASRITLCGLQPRDQVRQELAWCDVFALVGWDEPWGVVYNEAMAAGKPIVCANDGGINDVLINGQNALTVPPHDEAATAAALDQLLSDANLRTRLGSAAHALFISRLTWDANAKEMIKIFTEGVASANR